MEQSNGRQWILQNTQKQTMNEIDGKDLMKLFDKMPFRHKNEESVQNDHRNQDIFVVFCQKFGAIICCAIYMLSNKEMIKSAVSLLLSVILFTFGVVSTEWKLFVYFLFYGIAYRYYANTNDDDAKFLIALLLSILLFLLGIRWNVYQCTVIIYLFFYCLALTLMTLYNTSNALTD